MSPYAWLDELVGRLGYRGADQDATSRFAAATIERLESRLGGKLPADYAYFVARYGGAILGNEDFEVVAPLQEESPWGTDTRPETFYSLEPGKRWSIEEQLQTFADRLPAGVLPISHDAGGNQICLDVAGEFPGSVWFWDHEQRWFSQDLDETCDELDAAGEATRGMSVHDMIRAWARLHRSELDRSPDYVGMYRLAPTFSDLMRSLVHEPFQ
ncbi:MAG: SMI1/KNR4 family protein [Myxococcales bacterium]|nr:SMI1/KNR4 family protein [Myxococcales bacterium]